jgi:ATP-dependent helicase/DNAse subunit B
MGSSNSIDSKLDTLLAAYKQKQIEDKSSQPDYISPFWEIERDGVTQGLLANMATCPMKAQFKNVQGLNVRAMSGTSALVWGDIFHRALDKVYGIFKVALENPGWGDLSRTYGHTDDIVTDVLNTIHEKDTKKLEKALAPADSYSDLRFMIATCTVVLKAYFRRWENDYHDYEWRDLERVFNVPYSLIDKQTGKEIVIPVRGKLDGAFFDHNRSTWLFETKTKSVIDDSSISDRLNMDLQVMLYLWAMSQKSVYDCIPAGVIYNVVRRPMLRQGAKESIDDFVKRIEDDVEKRPDHYFMRYKQHISAQELGYWEATDLLSLMHQAYHFSQGDFMYRNTSVCMMYNKPCEYMRACSYGEMGYLKQREHVFPELEPED